MSVQRIKELQDRLAGAGIDAAVILYSRDLLYYAGTVQPCVLLVTPKDFHLFVRRGYDFIINETWLDRDRLSNESRLEAVSGKLKEWKVIKGSVGLELDAISAETYLRWRELLPGLNIVNVSTLILEQRKRKEPGEISVIREACGVIDAGHKRALGVLKEGMTELELSAAVEDAHRRAGHEGVIFIRRPDFSMGRGPVGSGANLYKISGLVYSLTGTGLSPAIPVGASLGRIKKGEPVVVDIPVLYHGYHADQSRTYVIGKANPEIRSLFYSLRDICDYVISHLAGGMKCSEIYRLAWQRAGELGVADYFQGLGNGKSSNFVAHGIGLEINEPPIVNEDNHSAIHAGYVLALDVHMMHPGSGVVKLEDTVLITEHGAEVLNISPRELFEV
jgi:Xaa-Pro aminopeptidase